MSSLKLHQTGPKGPVSVVIIPAKPAASRRADANANAPQRISWIKPAGSECIHPGDAQILSDPNPKKSQSVLPPDQTNPMVAHISKGFISSFGPLSPSELPIRLSLEQANQMVKHISKGFMDSLGPLNQSDLPEWLANNFADLMIEPLQIIEFATGGAI